MHWIANDLVLIVNIFCNIHTCEVHRQTANKLWSIYTVSIQFAVQYLILILLTLLWTVTELQVNLKTRSPETFCNNYL